jgi:hypothetical protein
MMDVLIMIDSSCMLEFEEAQMMMGERGDGK